MKSFYQLDPERMLKATEQWHLTPTGQFTQLNSFENRVFDIRLEQGEQVIAKVYRPGRWSKPQILEEHAFAQHLATAGIPVVTPQVSGPQGFTLYEDQDLTFSMWPKIRGRLPEEWDAQQARSVGRQIALFHNAAQSFHFRHRPPFAELAWDDLADVLNWVAPEVRHRYEAAATIILDNLDRILAELNWTAIHGDLHRGNLIEWKAGDQAETSSVTFLDLDDSGEGPAEQDLWMLVLDNPVEDHPLLQGYTEFRELNVNAFIFNLPLFRGHRIIRYSAWIAKRWEDPFFRATFPHFLEYTFWAEEVEALEKIAWTWRNE